MADQGYCQCHCGGRTELAKYSCRSRGWVRGQPMRYMRGHNSRRIPLRIPSSDPVEIAWAAGLYEGEGSITFDGSSKRRGMRLSVAMVDREPLDRFCEIVGAGIVRGPYGPYQPNTQPQWSYVCSGWNNCKQVVELIWDHLSPRRQEQVSHVVDAHLERR